MRPHGKASVLALPMGQRLSAIGMPGIRGTGSASQPSGYAENFARTPRKNPHHGAQDAIAPPATQARVPPYPPRSTYPGVEHHLPLVVNSLRITNSRCPTQYQAW